jgi:hypothetical protein
MTGDGGGERRAFLGETVMLPISALRLDPENPRLPAELQRQDQEQLAVDLALGFDAYTVAESMASHGYFASEPLIALPSTDEEDTYIVVEGNRRLTALLGLTRQQIRAQFADSEKWDKLAAHARVGEHDEIPVVLAPDRRSVTPIIGFRHISGILQWQPYAQARYIAKLVDDDGMGFAEVAEMIGIDRTKVGNLYRDQAIAEQARDLGIETGNLERSFSLLTVAMSTTKLRSHIDAPLGSKTAPGEPPIPEGKEPELRELLTWVFGDGITKPVISDSREISKLGNVVATDVGLKALRDGESLEHAVQKVKDAGTDPRKRLTNRLRTGKSSLLAAAEDIADFLDDDEVRELIDEARDAIDALLAPIDDASANA